MSVDEQIAQQEVTQGQYQVSIATSLAFETLFGINENVQPTDPLPYTHYKYVLINLRTLIRNLYGAVQKELKAEWTANRYLEKIKRELEMIPMILGDQSGGKLHTIYYIPSYRSIERKYPKALLRGLSKKAYGRQHYEAVEQYCVAQLSASAIREKHNIALLDVELPPVDARSLIITHMPIDLLSYLNTDLVDLIETHTGVIKPKNRWYTKLNGKNLERIPFAEWSIQFFGDGKTFAGMPPAYRQTVIDFAAANRWNQTTTDRLIKAQANRIPNPEVRQTLLKYL